MISAFGMCTKIDQLAIQPRVLTKSCPPIHTRFLGHNRLNASLGPGYFLLSLISCMMDICFLVTGAVVHKDWRCYVVVTIRTFFFKKCTIPSIFSNKLFNFYTANQCELMSIKDPVVVFEPTTS